MQTASLRFFSATLAAACFLTFAASQRVLAHQMPQPTPASSMLGYTTDHVLLTDDEAAGVVDVTSTLYIVQGQIYAVLHGSSIAIVVGSQDGNVYNTSGQVIGFVERVEVNASEAANPSEASSPETLLVR